MDFYSGVIKLREHGGWGGSKFDSRHMSEFIPGYSKPVDLGLMVSRIFSSSDKFSFKPFTRMTLASGNSITVDEPIFRWKAIGDDFQFNELVVNLEAGNARPGWAGETFKIALREGWYEEPMVIIGGSNNYPLEIVGKPIQKGTYYEYTVRLQSGNPNDFFDPSLLVPGQKFRRVSSSIADEMNQLYPGTDWGSQVEMQTQIGMFSGGFEVSDKVVIKEMLAKKSGSSTGEMTSGYTMDIATDGGKVIKNGMFMTFAEAKIIDQVEMDREWAMTFGKVSNRPDYTGRYIKRTGAGYREYCKDGHEYYYSTPPTAGELEDYFMSYIHNRVAENERQMVLSTGSLGLRIFDQLLSDEAGAFLTVDDGKFVRKMSGGKEGDLEYGYQFKRFVAKNGLTIDVVHDPVKDNKMFCPESHPMNPSYTIDSARMDVMSFAPVSQGKYIGKSNITMVKLDPAYDSYYWKSSVVDPRTGKLKGGAKAANDDKTTAMRYETSGGLVVFDPSLIGSLIYEPIR